MGTHPTIPLVINVSSCTSPPFCTNMTGAGPATHHGNTRHETLSHPGPPPHFNVLNFHAVTMAYYSRGEYISVPSRTSIRFVISCPLCCCLPVVPTIHDKRCSHNAPCSNMENTSSVCRPFLPYTPHGLFPAVEKKPGIIGMQRIQLTKGSQATDDAPSHCAGCHVVHQRRNRHRQRLPLALAIRRDRCIVRRSGPFIRVWDVLGALCRHLHTKKRSVSRLQAPLVR